MAGRRCPLACHTWPDRTEYKTCPACGQPTSYFPSAVPLDLPDARRAAFEAHYAKHDADSDPARLLPGQEEARFDVPMLPEDWPVLDQAPR